MKTIKVVGVVGRNTKRVREVQVETYTVWALDDGKWVEMDSGMSYTAAKTYRDELSVLNTPFGRRVTFLPCGTDPRRLGR